MWVTILVVATILVVGAGLRFLPVSPAGSVEPASSGPQPSGPVPPSDVRASKQAPPPLPFQAAEITSNSVGTTGFLSWALLDRRSGEIVGSPNLQETSTTASMIKAWLAADYLRRAEEGRRTPTATELASLETLIRDSDNAAADATYSANGKTSSIQRLIDKCNLTDSRPTPGLWSNTIISAQDSVRMGACIADGQAAGSTWTPWLLDMMRKVRGVGDFGIRKALPAAERDQVAIKNGWLLRDEDNKWHTNCLAIGDTWVLAIMQRYPPQGNYDKDFEHTTGVCTKVAIQLLNPDVS